MTEPLLYPRENYDTDQLYYDALKNRFKYLVDSYTHKLLYGLCTDLYEELNCLYLKLLQMEIALGVDIDAEDYTYEPQDVPPGTPDFIFGEQNNIIVEKTLGTINLSEVDSIVDGINILPSFTVSSTEIVIFSGEFSKDSEDFNTKFRYALNSGSGTYGEGETQITLSDLTLLNPVQPALEKNTVDIENLTEEVETNTTIINTLTQEDKIHSGRFFWTGTDLVFEYTPFVFTIANQTGIMGFNIPPSPNLVTLDDPEEGETNPRIDLIVLDIRENGLVVVKGTPSATPQEPTLEFGYQLRVTAVYVPVSGNPQVIVEPSDPPIVIENYPIYDENTGAPNEWNITSIYSDVVVNDATNPQTGSVSIKFPSSIITEEYADIEFTSASPLEFDRSSLLLFQFRHEGNWESTIRIRIKLEDTNTDAVYINFNTYSIATYGYNSASSDWQTIAVPINVFTGEDIADINKISIRANNSPVLYFDDIKIQTGNSSVEALSIYSDTVFVKTLDLNGVGSEKEQVRDYINSLGYNKNASNGDLWFEIKESFMHYKSVFLDGANGVAGLTLSSDGTVMIASIHNNNSFKYSLSTPYDVSTAIQIGTGDFGQGGGLHMTSDGLRILYHNRDTVNTVELHLLNSQYDIENHTLISTTNLPYISQDSEVFITDDGLNLYANYSGGLVHFQLNTAWDLTDRTEVFNYTDFPNCYGFTFSSDLKTIIAIKTNTGFITCTLDVAGDLSTATLKDFVVPISDVLLTGNFFKLQLSNNGSNLVVSAYAGIHSYYTFDLTIPNTLGKSLISTGDFISGSKYYRLKNKGRGIVSGVTVDDLDKIGETKIFSESYTDLKDVPTKTSQFINDGADGTSTYVEQEELDAIGAYNTVIKGVGSDYPTKYAFANQLETVGGLSWGTTEADNYIKNYKVNGDTITCYITEPYRFISNAWRSTLGNDNITHYYDYGGMFSNFHFQEFRYNTNIQELIFPKAKGNTSFVLEGNTALTKLIIPELDELWIHDAPALTNYDFTNVKSVTSFKNTGIVGTLSLPNATSVALGQVGNSITHIDLPRAKTLSGNLYDNSVVTSIYAPHVTTYSLILRNANVLTEIRLPECTDASGLLARAFECDSLTLIYLPKAKSFGNDATAGGFFTSGTFASSGGTIVINEYLKTSNGGNENANIADARALGANIIYVKDYNTALEETDYSVLGSYADDASASTGGVAIGSAYVNSTTGAIHRRLT